MYTQRDIQKHTNTKKPTHTHTQTDTHIQKVQACAFHGCTGLAADTAASPACFSTRIWWSLFRATSPGVGLDPVSDVENPLVHRQSLVHRYLNLNLVQRLLLEQLTLCNAVNISLGHGHLLHTTAGSAPVTFAPETFSAWSL